MDNPGLTSECARNRAKESRRGSCIEAAEAKYGGLQVADEQLGLNMPTELGKQVRGIGNRSLAILSHEQDGPESLSFLHEFVLY